MSRPAAVFSVPSATWKKLQTAGSRVHGMKGGGAHETKRAHMIAFYVILHSQTSSGGAQGGSEGKILSSVWEEV